MADSIGPHSYVGIKQFLVHLKSTKDLELLSKCKLNILIDLILEKSKPEGVLNNVVNILNFTKIFKIILRILFQHSPQKSSQGSH